MNRLTCHSRRWLILASVLLLSALMRFPALDRVPPGWRDDELIEIDMDSRIEQGWRPLYIREAEGHEPLYHYLHAGTLALFGHNTFGYRWLPAAFGTLSVALLFALARRLFGFKVAALTGALYGVGLWPVLYSRFGVRHIGVMPFILLALYALAQLSILNSRFSKRPLNIDNWQLKIDHWTLIFGISMGLGLYVYYAAWVMPALTIAFGVYLLVFDRQRFRQAWPALVFALAIAGIIFFPLGWDLAHGPRVTRIEVTGAPVQALLEGNPRPVLETTLGTLGMFTFKGDPEWLYNFSGLPVFDWIAGAAFYLGVLICLLRLRDARYGFVLAWLVVGLSPAFISVPPASFSHTIAAQGAVYLMPALALVQISNFKFQVSNLKWRFPHLRFEIWYLIFATFVVWVAWYTYHYYFDWWPNHAMVRFDYHADTHDLARWLDTQADGGDIAISTTSTQLAPRPFPLEPFALDLDLKRHDITPRWFDGAWALVFPNGGGGRIALLSFPPINPLLESFLPSQAAEYHNPPTDQLAFRVYRDSAAPGSRGATSNDISTFAGKLTLASATIPVMPPRDGGDGFLATIWRVDAPLTGPLKVFAHLFDANGRMIGGDDRLNVLVESLHPGDVFVQINRLPRPAQAACAPCRIGIGVYNPDTGERLRMLTSESLVLPIEVGP
jgi:hypothetical protein